MQPVSTLVAAWLQIALAIDPAVRILARHYAVHFETIHHVRSGAEILT